MIHFDSQPKLLKLGWRITSQNQEKLFFSALNISFHKINRESLLFKNLSGRAPVGFIKESALIALPNTPSVSLSLSHDQQVRNGRQPLSASKVKVVSWLSAHFVSSVVYMRTNVDCLEGTLPPMSLRAMLRSSDFFLTVDIHCNIVDDTGTIQ